MDKANIEKTLLLGNGDEPSTLDPHLATSVSEAHILFALFEGLVSPSVSNPDDIEPGVASRWEFQEQSRTYRFFLRPEARWSNGTPVTAHDFVGSARRALSPALGSSYPEMFFDIENAQAFYQGDSTSFEEVGVRAENDHTLLIKLGRPAPDFLKKLKHFSWLPVPVDAIEAIGPVEERSTRWAQLGDIVSNGPFQLASWTQNAFIEVKQNDFYWDSENTYLHKIRFFPYEDAHVEYRAFLAGQLHITDKIPIEHIGKSEQQTPQRSDPFLATSYLIFNTDSPKLDDPLLRKALSLALDKNSLATHINRSGRPASAFTPPGIEGYAPPALPEFNPREARRLVEGRDTQGGELPELSILVSNNPASRAIGEAVQAMWRENLSLDVSLVNMEAKTLFSSLNSGDFEISFLSWTGDYEDPTTFLDTWRSSNSKNRARWSDTAYDELLNEAAVEADPAARLALLAKAEALLLDQLPIIPIIWKTKNYCIAPSVSNWPPAVLDIRSYKGVTVSP